MTRLSLGDLFDLELLARKEAGESEEIRKSRYRNLGRRLLDQGVPVNDPGALLAGLLRLGEAAGTRSPGSRFESALAWLRTLLGLAGALCGAVVSLSLLHDSGNPPLNIFNGLAALVGTQLILLVLLVAALIPRNRNREPGFIQEILGAVLARILARWAPEAAAHLLTDLTPRLNAHMGLLRWVLVQSAQVFGVSFNLAVLAGCLFRAEFSHLAFSWSTTILDSSAFLRIAELLSAPWSGIFPRGVPTRELLDLTRYAPPAPVAPLPPSLQGAWFFFLFLSVTTYGLLPRLIALAVSGFRVRQILVKTPALNDDFRRLVDWMTLPLIPHSGAEQGPQRPAAPAEGPDAEAQLPPPGTRCDILLESPGSFSRDSLERLLRERFGWELADVLAPKDLAESRSELPLLVVVSAWDEPTKGQQRRFLAVPGKRLLIAGLLNRSPGGGGVEARLAPIRDRWKRHLHAALAGRPLRVEALELRP